MTHHTSACMWSVVNPHQNWTQCCVKAINDNANRSIVYNYSPQLGFYTWPSVLLKGKTWQSLALEIYVQCKIISCHVSAWTLKFLRMWLKEVAFVNVFFQQIQKIKMKTWDQRFGSKMAWWFHFKKKIFNGILLVAITRVGCTKHQQVSQLACWPRASSLFRSLRRLKQVLLIPCAKDANSKPQHSIFHIHLV